MTERSTDKNTNKLIIILLFIMIILLLAVVLIMGTMLFSSKKKAESTSPAPQTSEETETRVIASAYTAAAQGKLYWICDNILCTADILTNGSLSNIGEYGRTQKDITSIAIQDSALYFTTQDGLYRTETGKNLTNAQKIIDESYLLGFSLTDSYIYYNRGGNLYRTDISGQNKKELFSNVKDYIVTDNNIYCLSESGSFYSTDPDGSNTQSLLENSGAKKLLLYGSDLYIKGHALQIYHMADGSFETLSLPQSPDMEEELVITDDYLLYKSTSGTHIRYYTDGRTPEEMKYCFYQEPPYSVYYGNYQYYSFRSDSVTAVNLDTLKYEKFGIDTKTANTSTDADTTDAAAQQTSSGDYDIASNLVGRLTDDFGLIQSDYINIVFGYDDFANGLWQTEAENSTCISFYYSKAKKAGYGGLVFSIVAYDLKDNSCSDLPHYTLAGTAGNKKYIAVFPTDLQYDNTNDTQKKEYERMMEFALKIDVNNRDNPFSVNQ